MENLSQELQWAVQLLAAVLLALPTAWDREAESPTVGLRTFPLVSLGACAYILIAQTFIGPDNPDAMARIIQGLLAGIGFVGGGAILKDDDRVKGTASAASIWITGGLGAACAFQLWVLAIFLSALNFTVMLVLSFFKPKVETNEDGKH